MSQQSDDPNESEVLREAMQTEIAKVRTEIPGVIVSYDNGDQRASVRPVIEFSHNDPDTGERQTRLASKIDDVPVRFPRGKGGAFALTWPLEEGDWVTLQVQSHSIDEWLSTASEDNVPASERRFDISDVIAVPGPSPFADALEGDAVNTAAMVAKVDELHLGSSDPDDWVALANKTLNTINSLISSINSFLTSTYNPHTHNQITPLIPIAPNPITPPNSPASTLSSTSESDYKSDKVKSE